MVVGGWQSRRRGKLRILRHNGPEHILAFAPTRSGKGVSVVVPTLLEWRHSALVLDIKGENHAVTAGWRASQGQKVFKFEPAAESGSVRFNPLTEIRLGTNHEVADAQNIAMMIVDPEGKGLSDFWMKSGFPWLGAALMHVLCRTEAEEGRRATLTDLCRFVSQPGENIEVMLEEMADYDHGRAAANDMVHQEARTMLARAPAERSGVHSTVLTELALYRDPIVSANIAASDFSLEELVNGPEPATLYLVVAPSDIDRLRPLLRAVLNIFLRRLTTTLELEDGVAKGPHRHRLLLLLDEFTAFGKLDIFQRALGFMAGYGLKCMIIVQDLTQLQEAYGKHESIMSNCHVRIAFAPNKVETAKVLSDMTGRTTIVQKRRSRSRKPHQASGSLSESLAATGRPLMTPDECMTMPGMQKTFGPDGAERARRGGDMLIFPAGFSAIYGRQPLFFQNEEWLRRSRIPPPEAAAAARQAPPVAPPAPVQTAGKRETIAVPSYRDLLQRVDQSSAPVVRRRSR